MRCATAFRLLVVFLAVATASAASAKNLRSPYSASPSMPGKAEPIKDCPHPLPSIRDLDIAAPYDPSDYTHMVPARVADLEAKTDALHRAVGTIVDLANRSLELSGAERDKVRSCALDLLSGWFADGALLGNVSWPQGEYERMWNVVALGLSYMQLYSGQKNLPAAAPVVHDWFIAATSNLAERFPLDAPLRNNHWYWGGLAAIVAGTIADNVQLYDFGMAQYAEGLQSIDKDGYLPLELKRGGRSLGYHVLSASALTMMAGFADANGTPLSGQEGAALKRLVHRIFAGLADPSGFAESAGEAQSTFDDAELRGLAWLEVYYRLTGDKAAEPWLRRLRPLTQVWVGGDTTAAFGNPIGSGPKASSPLMAE